MTTREVADRLVSLCRRNRWVEAIRELYAEDVRQMENGEIMTGREPLAQACQGWLDSRELHATELLGVHVGEDAFVVEYRYDLTPHATRERTQWAEAGVYRVSNGKVVEVRFYYKPPGA